MQKSLNKIILLICLFSVTSFAQRRDVNSPEEKEGLDDSKYLGYGATTSTNSSLLGGLVFRSSTPVSMRGHLPVHRYIAVEAVNIKHAKEYGRLPIGGSKFALGKTNYFFAVRPEFGREWYFFKKDGESSIGLSGILAAGPSFGIQKPYHIKYRVMDKDPITTVYDPDIHTNLSYIRGSAGIWEGLLQNTSIIPGIHVKAAMSIDMSTFGDNVTGFELGTTLELFTKEPEIISSKLTTNKRAYASAYLTLYFGSKKLKEKKERLFGKRNGN